MWIFTHLSLISGLISVYYLVQSSQLQRFSSRDVSCHFQAGSVLQSTSCVPSGIHRSGFSTELVCSGAGSGPWAELLPRMWSQISLSLIIPGCPACWVSLVFCQWVLSGAALQGHRRRIILSCRGWSPCAPGVPRVLSFETLYGLVLGENERLWAVLWWLGRAKSRGATVSGATGSTKMQQLQKKWERAMKGNLAKILGTEQEKFPQSKVYPALLWAFFPAFLSWGGGREDALIHVSPTKQIAFLILWVHWISFAFRIFLYLIIFVCISSWFIWTWCIFQDVFHMICENISTYFLPLTWQPGILIIVLGAFRPWYRDLWAGKLKLIL